LIIFIILLELFFNGEKSLDRGLLVLVDMDSWKPYSFAIAFYH